MSVPHVLAKLPGTTLDYETILTQWTHWVSQLPGLSEMLWNDFLLLESIKELYNYKYFSTHAANRKPAEVSDLHVLNHLDWRRTLLSMLYWPKNSETWESPWCLLWCMDSVSNFHRTKCGLQSSSIYSWFQLLPAGRRERDARKRCEDEGVIFIKRVILAPSSIILRRWQLLMMHCIKKRHICK